MEVIFLYKVVSLRYQANINALEILGDTIFLTISKSPKDF